MVGACGETASKETPRCDAVELLVAVDDEARSKSGICGIPGGCVTSVELGKDPTLAVTNGRAFFVARDNDLVFEVDPSCGTPLSRLSLNRFAPRDANGSVGAVGSANPHDVAAARDGTLVVPLYDVPVLAWVARDGAITEVNLAPYDPDGNPQAESVSIVDVGGTEKAFVALERLDDNGTTKENTYLRSRQPSQMLRLDVATRAVEAVIELEGRNPFNPMAVHGSALFLAEAGNFDAADDARAGIERFDTATSTTRLLVRESDLGASVTEVAITEGCGAAIVAGPREGANPTAVVTFDPETGEIFTRFTAPLFGPTDGFDLQGLAWRGDTLYVGDRRRAANGYPVHVFTRTSGCTLTRAERTLDMEQPPVTLRSAL